MIAHFPHRILCTTLLICLTILCAPAQGQRDVRALLQKLMDDLRNGKAETAPGKDLYHPGSSAALLPALLPYCRDSSDAVRCKAYRLTAQAGVQTNNPTLRKQAVRTLLQGCEDLEGSVSGICSKALQQFSPIDFDDQARGQLGTLLTPDRTYLDNLAQLAAYVGQPEYEGTLQHMLLHPKLSKKHKWALQLALARMGNLEILSRVISRIKSIPLNDDLVHEAAPALVYVRQPQSLAYLFELIMRDDRSCSSANPDSDEKLPCAYRVLEYLAPVVKDFPLKLDESGDLDVKDYQVALKTARDWYSKHQDNYTLIKDSF